MKNLFSVLIMGFSIIACKNKSTGLVEITIDLKDVPAQTVYLKNLDGKSQPLTVDSINYQGKGALVLRTKVIEPSYFQVVFNTDKSRGKFIPIITDGEKILIKGDYNNLEKMKIEGSPNTNSLIEFFVKNNEAFKKMDGLAAQLETMGNTNKTDSLKKALEINLMQLEKNTFDNKLDYARKAINPINAFICLTTLNPNNEKSLAMPLIDSLKNKFSNSSFFQNGYASYFAPTVNNTKPEQINNTVAKEITSTDVNGKTVTLSSFKGKYVLIDFWASWCGPCRGENPNVVAAYHKFKDKNFTILGVSFDDNKDAWLKAIADDKLPWTQVSDLKKWENPARVDYGIESIPANFLVDPNGNIIAQDLRGGALHSKLEEVLK
jgi:thiol-disulfide isomerase/thioredoxin